MPIIVPTARISVPEESKIGSDRLRISVVVLSCFGNRDGVSVASIRPSATETAKYNGYTFSKYVG